MSALIASAGICLGRKLFLSSCDGWLSQSLPYLVFHSLSGVLLQLVRCLEGSEVVAGLAVLQNVPSISSSGLHYIAILIFDGSVCVLVLS